MAGRSGNPTDRSAGLDPAPDRGPTVDRFVGRPQVTRVLHRHDTAPRDQSREADHAGPRRQHGLADVRQEVDPAMAGAPGRGGRLEAPDHRGWRLERPAPVRRRGAGRTPDRLSRSRHPPTRGPGAKGRARPVVGRDGYRSDRRRARQRHQNADESTEPEPLQPSSHGGRLPGMGHRGPDDGPGLWTVGRCAEAVDGVAAVRPVRDDDAVRDERAAGTAGPRPHPGRAPACRTRTAPAAGPTPCRRRTR
jgi:hypothetical protein